MIYRLSDNIISPLGTTTADNYQAVKARRSAVHRYDSRWNVREPFAAALFSDEQNRQLAVKGLTRFESLAFRSAQQAIRESGIDVSSSRALFILSTTKANIELLGGDADDGVLSPADAAKRVAERLGFSTEPLVVCNACISGAAAIITALRLLDAGLYDYAVICGADVQSEFTVSGFQSLKAVSPDECRPFDIERIGLNLGEAAATLVVASPRHLRISEIAPPHPRTPAPPSWALVKGSIHNDAFHISSPSKDGQGALLALEDVLSGVDTDDLAVVNAHGTATMFNDQMESVAIERAGLNTVNVNALKGYFAHTLGAAGLLETIMTMASLDDRLILATRGYGELGVSGKIHLSSEHRPTSKTSFIKMISGFGGGNAALYIKQTSLTPVPPSPRPPVKRHTLKLTPTSLTIDAHSVNLEKEGADLLTSLYKQYVDDYPKYYKMDGLCRLGFIAAELLVKQENSSLLSPPSSLLSPHSSLPRNRAVILFNHSSSIAVDRRYFDTIADKNDYFPSPSAFVYTLPNIVTGEIAIRHHYQGETSFYITDCHDSRREWQILCASMADPVTNSAIAGWIDYVDDHHFEADMYIVERQIIET